MRTLSEDDDLLLVVWRPVSDGSKVLFPDSIEAVRVDDVFFVFSFSFDVLVFLVLVCISLFVDREDD